MKTTECPSDGLHTYALSGGKTVSANKRYFVVVYGTTGSAHADERYQRNPQ